MFKNKWEQFKTEHDQNWSFLPKVVIAEYFYNIQEIVIKDLEDRVESLKAEITAFRAKLKGAESANANYRLQLGNYETLLADTAKALKDMEAAITEGNKAATLMAIKQLSVKYCGLVLEDNDSVKSLY